MQAEIQLEMLKALKELREPSRHGPQRGAVADDAPGQDLDGLRVTRTLGRMRALRENVEQNPNRSWREYRQGWISELGLEGRGSRWTDRHKAIKWQKYASIKRCDWMMCHVLETLEKGKPELARAQLVQCLKALDEFTRHGSWRSAWPLTHMVDPLRRQQHGGTEVETEVILGWLKTQDDLRAKVLKGTKELVSDGESDQAEASKGRGRGRGRGRGAGDKAEGEK